MNLERLRNSVVVFFGGIALIVATVMAVYFFTFLMDKLSCCNGAVLTEEEMEERRTASTVTKQSGLAGLLKDERNQIYRVFFERRSFPYHQPPPTAVIPDDSQQNMHVAQEFNKSEMDDMKQVADEVSVDETDIEDGQAPTCSICLCEYDVGDKVILGSTCSHMFHYDCCMQWVDKGDEHCPYCRENMISPIEFHETAIEVVGGDRVNKLKKINQAAAERLAALLASGEQTIASPVPPVGQTIPSPTVAGAVIVVASPGPGSVEPIGNTVPSEQQDAKDDSLQSANDDEIIVLASAKDSESAAPVEEVQTGNVTDSTP